MADAERKVADALRRRMTKDRMARFVVRELMNPTPAMIEAGAFLLWQSDPAAPIATHEGDLYSARALEVFRTMLSAETRDKGE